jgi:hypothetical protein
MNKICYERPFSPSLPVKSEEFEELASQRAAGFSETLIFSQVDKNLQDAVQAVKDGSERNDLLIEESVNALWIAAFKAGYRAGMVDIMAAMTLKQLGIVSPKYLKGV